MNLGTETGIHVVFGSGPVGMAVMQELLARGKRVRMVNRSGRADVPPPVEVVRADATDPVTAGLACRGAEVIYHCAKAPYTEWPEKFPPIMDGIIRAAADAGARLIYADNLYMYGPVDGPITEALPYRATGRKGRTRAQMADALMEAHRTGRVRAAICRASDFFGPGVLHSAMGERVFGAALAGRPAELLGSLDVPHTYTYIRDFARALVTLGERDEALGQVWHAPSAPTITTRQFLEMVFAEAGEKPRFRVAPRAFVALMGLFNPTIRELKEMLYTFERPYVVDHSRYARAFGDHSTPHPVAIRETLDWYRRRDASNVAAPGKAADGA